MIVIRPKLDDLNFIGRVSGASLGLPKISKIVPITPIDFCLCCADMEQTRYVLVGQIRRHLLARRF